MSGALSAALRDSRQIAFATPLLGIGALTVTPSSALSKHRSLALEEGVQCSVATASR
jgi:hypothetical protein